MKQKKKKSNIVLKLVIVLVAILIIAGIINLAPNYIRDENTGKINVIINNHNVTESMKFDCFVDENDVVYLSTKDIANFFDEDIFYDNMYNQIITTSNTKVANIVINEKKITINDITQNMLEPVIKINDKIYIPISDMDLVYNISVKYVESTNIVIIDDLNKGLVRADVAEDTKIKYKPRSLSKNIGELKKGDVISCFYTTRKGWREIRTEDGITRIYKSK